jgi:undecaprenyl-diphosphatase
VECTEIAAIYNICNTIGFCRRIRCKQAEPVGEKMMHLKQSMRFLKRRFSPRAYLGLHLTAGVLLLIGSAGVFGGLAEMVLHDDPLIRADAIVASWFHTNMTAGATLAMKYITELAAFSTLSVLASLLALVLVVLRKWEELLLLVLTIPGGRLLGFVLKSAFQRQRPHFGDLELTVHGFSFPSDHTMDATLLYGLLVVFAIGTFRRWSVRLTSAATGSLLVILVALSRVALDAHYLSDVLGAIAASVAWLALCFTVVDTFRRRRQNISQGTHRNIVSGD